MIFNFTNDANKTSQMRTARNQLLAQSDWTQLADAQCDKTAWAAYRQALRDFPSTWETAETADFPEMPA